MSLTIADIRKAVKKLRKANISPHGDCYLAPVRRGAMVDLLLTYKRPRSTKLYRMMRNWS